MATKETDGLMLLLLRSPAGAVPEGVVKKVKLDMDKDRDFAVVYVDVRETRGNICQSALHLHGVSGIFETEERKACIDNAFFKEI